MEAGQFSETSATTVERRWNTNQQAVALRQIGYDTTHESDNRGANSREIQESRYRNDIGRVANPSARHRISPKRD